MPTEHREDWMDVESGAGGGCSGTGWTGEGPDLDTQSIHDRIVSRRDV